MATDTLAHSTAHAHEHAHHDTGPTKVFGFWIYLMSDCILFCCLFATYAVLVNGTAGGPAGKDIFELPFVLVETALLLFSSITYGMAAIAMYKNNLALVVFVHGDSRHVQKQQEPGCVLAGVNLAVWCWIYRDGNL